MQPGPDASAESLSVPIARFTSPGAPSGEAVVSDPPYDSFDGLYVRRPRVWLVVILVAYAVAALLFAVNTPPWQAPDEPAHYNYIAHIAETVSLPMLEIGDYDQALLDQLRDSRFAGADVSALRYEYHQPPLYYLLATPVYWLSGGNLLALRIFSIVVGACATVLLYMCLELVFPTKTLIVVGATAFSALLPMHVAVLASVNNDGLAELLVLASMLAMLTWMRQRFYGADSDPRKDAAERAADRQGREQLLVLGILLGLGMLTKVYAYVLAPMLWLAIVIVTWLDPAMQRSPGAAQQGPSWRTFWSGVGLSLWTAVPAMALAALWWIRNVVVYGGWDVLGLAQHGRVVADQPRTVDWIAVNGWVAYGERAFAFTFRSFWGVFGWMGVFMDERVYTAFYLFAGVVYLGLLWAIVRLISGRPDADMDLLQLWVLGLFGVMIAAVSFAYVWYNMEFVQHQGRYFFWGLLPIGTVVAFGWREVMQPLQGLITAVLALAVTVGTALSGYVTSAPNKWTVLTAASMAGVLLLQALLLAAASEGTMRRMPSPIQEWMALPAVSAMTRWARSGLWALPFILLFVLDLSIPFVTIAPQLVW